VNKHLSGNLQVVAVDDEEFMLEQFRVECERLDGISSLKLFDDPAVAFEYFRENSADVVFLDVEMPGMNGIELAGKIRHLYPKIIVIFITAYESYMIEAVRMKSDYYVLKPYSSKDIREVIERAQLLSERLEKRVKVKCFGEFEILVDNRPIIFKSQKARELAAILINKKGAIVSPEEAFGLMWADKVYDNYTGSAYRKALAKLEYTLEEHGCREILLRASGGSGIDKNAIECDYYNYLDGNYGLFAGEYMHNYEWAVPTLGKMKQKPLTIVAVDDEQYMLEQFRMGCEGIKGITLEKMFNDSAEAAEYLDDHPVDAVFLDIEMPGMKGIAIAEKLREKNPKIIIIFISAYESYIIDAVHVKCDYYLLKPYSTEELNDVIQRARLLSARLEQKVKVQCFGEFQIYSNHKPVAFRSKKAKELAAILVHNNGMVVSPEEAFNLMWPGKEYDNYTGSAYRKVLAKLNTNLEKHGCEEILVRMPKGCRINKDIIECDYYDYLDGKSVDYSQGYLNEYEWAVCCTD